MPPTSTQAERALRVIERLEEEVAALRRAQTEPIAIVGMSCRFPGAPDVDRFWSLLESGDEATSEVPAARWDIDALYDADPDAPGKMTTRYGGFVDGVDRFDAAFFNIAPREAALMDPQQRILLELAWQALEDAALSPDALYGSPSGVFVGICAPDYARMAAGSVDNLNAYFGTGNAPSVAAGRIAYTFGFSGPCMSIDTACSSALVAVHAAADSLRRGECDVALAASVNLTLSPEPTIAFSRARMMAPDGRCKTFDERADGYVRSEGAAVVVLKKLSAARADGDRIRAVIRGTSINQDGASGGLTVPNGPSQVALIRQALSRAGLAPRDIDYVEAHGTGTALGDPIEVGALGEVFARGREPARPLLLGSVKTVVGHLELAAGMAGLLKVVLALENQAIPGYRHLQQLSSRIPWDRLPFEVVREPRPWARNGRPRRAGISAFGFSGTNAHVVVEEAPLGDPAAPPPQPSHVVPLSARTPEALTELAGRYAAWLDAHPAARLDQIAWTASVGRAHLPHRLAVQAADPAELRQRLAAFAEGGAAGPGLALASAAPIEPALAFLFSGQGAQRAGMGRELHDLHPVFRAALEECEELLAAHLEVPLRRVLWGDRTELLGETAYTQPALVSFEVALARLWQSWGIRPTCVMGHSVGEVAAACVAEVFSLADALRLIAARGRLMQSLPGDGAMAVVLAGRDAVAPLVEAAPELLSMAAFNAPDQTVLSGDRQAVLEACRLLEERGVRNRGLLAVSHAFHSPLMRPMLDEFRAVAGSIAYQQPAIEIVSNVTGALVADALASPDYWVDHVLAPVDFLAGVGALDRRGVDALLEIGPRATLIGLADACAGPGRFRALASMRGKTSEWSQMLDSLGALAVHGHAVDWRAAGRAGGAPPDRLALPTYPFQRQRHWIREGGAALRRSEPAGHPLLGDRLASAALPAGDLLFESALAARRPAYLEHHRVYDKVVAPAAAFVEIALAGVHREFPGAAAVLRNLTVQTALVLPREGEAVVQSHYADAGESRYRFKLWSAHREGGGPAGWQLHITGDVELLPAAEPGDAPDLDALRRRFASRGEPVSVEAFYRQYQALGLDYGPLFRSVGSIERVAGDEPELLARIAAPELSAEVAASYVVHPALLDGCFQSLAALVEGGASSLFLPVGIESVAVWRPGAERLWAHARLRRAPSAGDPRVVADLRLYGEEGGLLGVVVGLQAVRVDRRALANATATWKDSFYAVTWAPGEADPPRTAAEPGAWLVVADRGGLGRALAERLEAAGGSAVLVGEDDLDVGDKAAWARLLTERAERDPTPLSGIAHLLAVDETGEPEPSAIAGAQARLTGSALAVVQALLEVPDQRLPRLWLITRGAQIVSGGDPIHAAQTSLWGLGRTIALEHPALGATCLDLDHTDADALAAELLRGDPELQIAHRDGARHLARLSRVAPFRARQGLAVPPGPYRLRTEEYGSFDRLALVPAERPEPGAGEVEIEVAAAAINFKDVLHCLGMLKEWSERAGILQAIDQPLGFECAGRVARVGAGVTRLAVGDEVFTMAPSAMASHVTIGEHLVHRKPRRLGFEEAASLPAAFMTAIHSLDNLARIRPGDRVLIHACAGGVGQAALQIARARGAVVYGTASPAKWQHLREQGVEHLMNSRTLDFADEIRRVTDGRGVDVVLNSLTGDFIQRSADALSPGGRFVEIGKIGIWTAEQMAAYRPDVAYFSFDLGDVEGEGALQAELLGGLVRGLDGGELSPLPVLSFPIQEAAAGFRHLARARNIGKVVLSLPAGPPSAGVRADRSVLVTGGLGALGLRVAEGLVASGARQIVLAGRSDPDERARAAVERLRAAGARVEVAAVDVADADQVGGLLRRIAAELDPLGGIVHAAGVLDDATLTRQSGERFARVFAPKVTGAWHLHAQTADQPLDFFVLFSSAAAVLGAPGQANYAAANAALEALAHHRRSRGLPATCIHWGPWASAGMAEKTRSANRARFESFGLRRLAADDGIEVLGHLMASDPAPTGAALAVLDVDWARYLKMVRSPGVARFYAPIDRGAALADREEIGGLLRRLTAEPEARRAPILTDYLRGQIAGVVGLASPDEIGLDQPLLDIGFDSLMAVELKSRIEASLGCALGAALLFDHPTLARLVPYLLADVLHLAASAAPESAAVESAAESAAESASSGEPSGPPPLAGMRESFVDAGDGRRLCVCAWGAEERPGDRAGSSSRPLAVLVHGILDQAAIWDEVAAGLVADGHRVLALDLRGHGRSDHQAPRANITVMDFLVDLTAVVEGEVGPPFVLVGHSIGAAVAALYASAFPDRVSHLVLVEPVMPALRERHDPLELLRSDLRFLRDAPAHAVYPDLRTAAQMLTLAHRSLPLARAARLAERITRPCDGGVRWAWDPRMRNPLGVDFGFSPEHFLSLASGLAVDSTRLYGTESQFAGTPVLVPPDLAWPGSRSVAIAGGHNLHTEAAAAVLQELQRGIRPARDNTAKRSA